MQGGTGAAPPGEADRRVAGRPMGLAWGGNCSRLPAAMRETDPQSASETPPETPAEAPRLADGSAPMTPDEVLAYLARLGIAAETVSHPPVFTVEEAKALRGQLSGGHTKNLFLRNKKGRMWLVTCLEDRQIDLKALAERLGGGRFSFGSAERLMAHLGVTPGAVTALAVINDSAGAVEAVLDEGLLAYDRVNVHPLSNDRTTALATADLLKFYDATDHPPLILDLGGL
jgi:Ala-tRNA(Pro) deacylase